MLLGAPLALEVHRHEVRPGGDEEPDDLAAESGVAHGLGDLAEDAAGDAAVALGVAVAEGGVGLVDHHGHGVHRSEEREDLLEVPLGDALPLAAEVLQLHHRDADLAREGGDEERLAGADGPGDEVAHRHHVRAALLDGLGGGAEVRLRLGVAGHHVEVEVGLDELQQAVGLGLDELLLLLGELLEREADAVLDGVGEDGAELDVPEAGRVLRQREGADVGEVLERLRPRALPEEPGDERLPGGGVRHLDLDLGVVGALDELAVEVRQVLRDEHAGEVALEEEGVVAPLLEGHEGAAVLGRVLRGLGHGHDGFGVVHHDGDALALAEADAEVVVEEGEDADGVLRQPLGVLRPEDGVVAGEGAVEVGLGGLVEEVDAVGAVVEQHHVAPGEEVVGEEVAEGDVGAGALGVLRRHEVADVAVEDELVERLGEVLPGEGLGPGRVVADDGVEVGLGHCRVRSEEFGGVSGGYGIPAGNETAFRG